MQLTTALTRMVDIFIRIVVATGVLRVPFKKGYTKNLQCGVVPRNQPSTNERKNQHWINHPLLPQGARQRCPGAKTLHPLHQAAQDLVQVRKEQATRNPEGKSSQPQPSEAEQRNLVSYLHTKYEK